MSDQQQIEEAKTFLSAAEILGADDLKLVEIRVPEWGGSILVKPLTAAEALDFFEGSKNDKNDSMVRLVAMSVVDQNGTALFSTNDLPKLRKKGLKAITRLQDELLRLNGLKEDRATVKNA